MGRELVERVPRRHISYHTGYCARKLRTTLLDSFPIRNCVVAEDTELSGGEFRGRIRYGLHQFFEIQFGERQVSEMIENFSLMAGSLLARKQFLARLVRFLALNPDGYAVGDGFQRVERIFIERPPSERCRYSYQAVFDNQGISRKCDYALFPNPIGIADSGIPDDVIRKMGLPLPRNPPSLEFPQRYASVGTAQMPFVPALACNSNSVPPASSVQMRAAASTFFTTDSAQL